MLFQVWGLWQQLQLLASLVSLKDQGMLWHLPHHQLVESIVLLWGHHDVVAAGSCLPYFSTCRVYVWSHTVKFEALVCMVRCVVLCHTDSGALRQLPLLAVGRVT